MENILSVFRSILSVLEAHRIDYMVVGSVASIVYGEPRLTKDMDLVVELPPGSVPRFHTLFPEERFYVPPIEVLADEVSRRGQFNLLDQRSGLKIDFVVRKNTPYAREEFSRRRRISLFPDFDAYVAAPEDVILGKLMFFREGGSEKHIGDIRGVLANTPVDSRYIERWVGRLALQAEWARVSGG